MNIVVTMEKDKETKNTIRYREITEDDEPPIIGSIYINKQWANKSETITVTVKEKRDDTV